MSMKRWARTEEFIHRDCLSRKSPSATETEYYGMLERCNGEEPYRYSREPLVPRRNICRNAVPQTTIETQEL